MTERRAPMRMTLSRDSALEIDVLAPGEPAKRVAIAPIDDDTGELDIDVGAEVLSVTGVIGTRLTPRPARSERPSRMTMSPPRREKGGA